MGVGSGRVTCRDSSSPIKHSRWDEVRRQGDL